MVKLNLGSVIKGKDRNRAAAWDQLIQSEIGDGYSCVATEFMVGQYIAMYVKDEIKPEITAIKQLSLKTGYYGLAGNKGCVALRFKYQQTSFAFINVHLEHRQNGTFDRLENLREVVSSTLNQFCDQHEYKCVFGDLNFRIDMNGNQVRDLIEKNDYVSLLEKDQLNKCSHHDPILHLFQESAIDFAPTYKYDKNSQNYDTSKKKRIQSAFSMVC